MITSGVIHIMRTYVGDRIKALRALPGTELALAELRAVDKILDGVEKQEEFLNAKFPLHESLQSISTKAAQSAQNPPSWLTGHS